MELLRDRVSYGQAARKYGVSKTTLIRWYNEYSSELGSQTPVPMSEEEKNLLAAKDAELAALQKALKQSQLEKQALEVMIEIAEKELKIDIRKKSGSKQ